MTTAAEIYFNSDIKLERDPTQSYHAVNKGYVDTVAAGKSASTHTHTVSAITGLGTAATVNTGTASGNIPILDESGKLSISVIPATVISSTFVVASQSDMLALNAQEGDVAVRTDVSKSFILAGDDPTTLSDWQELLSPTNGVTTVNGASGDVTITCSSIGAATTSHDHDSTYLKITTRGSASGVASLDSGTKIPFAQLPSQSTLSSSSSVLPTSSAVKNYVDGQRYSTTITGTGSATSFAITHGLDTLTPEVAVYRDAGTAGLPSWVRVYVAFEAASSNAVSLVFAVAPSSGSEFTVVVRK